MKTSRERSVLRWTILSFHAASAALAFLAIPLFVLASGGWTPVSRQATLAGTLLGVGALAVCVLAGDLLHARDRPRGVTRGSRRRASA